MEGERGGRGERERGGWRIFEKLEDQWASGGQLVSGREQLPPWEDRVSPHSFLPGPSQ